MNDLLVVGFTVHGLDGVLRALTFFSEHVIYWLLPLVLIFEFRYLCSKKRLHHIAMAGWGEASRAEQPAFFILLWALHLILSVLFAWAFLAYMLEQTMARGG